MMLDVGARVSHTTTVSHPALGHRVQTHTDAASNTTINTACGQTSASVSAIGPP